MSDFSSLFIEPLGKRHYRSAFSCGESVLNDYLKRQASQDVRRRISRIFVCTLPKQNAILGFYTLSAMAVDVSVLPSSLSRKLPRHPIPCALVGRLAVDQSAQGHGLGRMLLMDAIKRTLAVSADLAIHAMIVDAKNDAAAGFYASFGFIALEDAPHRMFLPLGVITL